MDLSRPLFNVFAHYHRDSQVLDRLERALRSETRGRRPSSRVWRPAKGWVAAVDPFPGSPSALPEFERFGLIFAEGAEVAAGSAAPSTERTKEIVDLARFSPDKLSRLPGDFGFILLSDKGTATVVRSCAGLVPLYAAQEAGSLTIATRLADFAAFSDKRPALDPLVNAIWAQGHSLFPYDRTLLSGVSIVPPGHFRQYESGSLTSQRRYWLPKICGPEAPVDSERRERCEALRQLLLARLARDLDPDGGNLLSLSGGVDSSSLGALSSTRWPTSTLTLVPPDPSDAQLQLFFIDHLASQSHFERMSFFTLDEMREIRNCDPPPRCVCQVMHPILIFLPKICREAQVRVLFGGEFADEVCGSVFTVADWAQTVSVAEMLADLGRNDLPCGSRDALRWAKHRLLRMMGRPRLPYPARLPSYIRAEIRDEYAEWASEERTRTLGVPVHKRALWTRFKASGFPVMNWEATSALGVRRCFPFFNREILELAFAAHPGEMVGPGTKKLLRAALRGDVPPVNLDRPDKGDWRHEKGRQVQWSRSTPDELYTIIRPGWPPKPPQTIPQPAESALTRLIQINRSLELFTSRRF